MFCDGGLYMPISNYFSFLIFISKDKAWISNSSLQAWVALAGKDPSTYTNNPPLFAETYSWNALQKPGIKNCAVGKEVSSFVSQLLGCQRVQNLSSLSQKTCYIQSSNSNKRDWCRNGGLPLFYYFTVQSYLLCVGRK